MEPIGESAWGTLYKLRHTVTQMYHVLRVPQGARPRLHAALRKQAQLQRLIAHPNLLPITDTLEDGDAFGVIYDFVDGTSLRDVLGDDGTPMDLAEAMPLFEQILEGLSAAHAAGLVHEALSPQSVLLAVNPTGVTVRLAEFGFWRAFGGVDGEPCVQREPYMAPEVLEGSTRGDARSDVFSLGCLLYEMLVGKPPYGEGARIRPDGSPNYEPMAFLLTACPLSVTAVVDRALELDPQLRYPDVESLVEALVGDAPPTPVKFEREVISADPGPLPVDRRDSPGPVAGDPDLEPPVRDGDEAAIAPSTALPRPPAGGGAGRSGPPEADPAWLGLRWALLVIVPLAVAGALVLLGAWSDAAVLRPSREAAALAREVVHADLEEARAAGDQLLAWGAPAAQLRVALDEASRATGLDAQLDSEERLLEALERELLLLRGPEGPEDIRKRREIERMIATNRDHLPEHRAAAAAAQAAEARAFAGIADSLGLAGAPPAP